MRFVADESLDFPIIERLRGDGHIVDAVVELAPGSSDAWVLDLANRQVAVLLTADKDFGELVYRQRRAAAGVVLVRFAGLPPADKAAVVASAVKRLGDNLRGAFTVITPTSIRHRPRGPARLGDRR